VQQSSRQGVGARLRVLAPAGYMLAMLLVVFPLSEVATSSWPVRALDPGWRYGALGFLSRALMTPMLGLGLAVMLAVTGRNDRFAFFITVLSFVSAVLLLAVASIMALDAQQVSYLLQEDLRPAFAATTVHALAKFGWASITMLLLGLGLTKLRKKQEERRSDESAGVVVGASTLRPAGRLRQP
jgi:hypothetical protein